MFTKNCCDGAYNSFDIHFTSACDNKCRHCIDQKYTGFKTIKPDPDAIAKTIIENKHGYDDVLFLGGEPCLFLPELKYCIEEIKKHTKLKCFVTTAVPKTCADNEILFNDIINLLDGINLSVQHHNEKIADDIRQTKSKYDRQLFYKNLSKKEKIRINLNIVKPFLYTKEDLLICLNHYDKFNFNSIKLSEIQHGKDHYVSFEKLFNINLGSPYSFGCQKYLPKEIINIKTPVLLKRSCFLCEETLKASFLDGIKLLYRGIVPAKNNYAVIYEQGQLLNSWR